MSRISKQFDGLAFIRSKVSTKQKTKKNVTVTLKIMINVNNGIHNPIKNISTGMENITSSIPTLSLLTAT